MLIPDLPREALLAKLEEALRFVALYAPQSHQRLRRMTGVFVFGHVGPSGQWERDAQLVRLSETYVGADATGPIELAATIVHEVMHARLEDRGVEYREDRRRGIEAVCIRAMARFADRVPGAGELATNYRRWAEEISTGSDDYWSDAAFRTRRVEALVTLGAPKWLLRLLRMRSDGMKHAGQRDRTEAHDG